METDRPYLLSFTTGGLFLMESIDVTRLYLAHRNWNDVKSDVIRENVLQIRTESSRKRVFAEIYGRLSTLTEPELRFLVAAHEQDAAHLLWIAVCRRYRIIAEFAFEVVRERHLAMKPDLDATDFYAFIHNKAEWNPELDAISPLTLDKLRQVLFKMMREAGMVSKSGEIQPVYFGAEFLHVIGSRSPELSYFPSLFTEPTGIHP